MNPLVSFAFKPITHVWIAQQVLNDLRQQDNHVIIDGRRYKVESSIADAIKGNASAYRMGSIGPDAFPDIVVGQMTVHPGDPANHEAWQTDRWLTELLKRGRRDNGQNDDEMISFAYGNIAHAASDIFAHTYVNTYSGDVFEIHDANLTPSCDGWAPKCWKAWARSIIRERGLARRYANEEKRHFALESYIARHTPSIRDHKGDPVEISKTSLTVPATKVADFFIRDENVRRAYDGRWFAWHLRIMAGHRDNVDSLRRSASLSAAELTKLTKARDFEAAEINRLSSLKSTLSKTNRAGLEKRKVALKKSNDVIKKLYELSADGEAITWLKRIDTALDDYIEMGRRVAIELSKKDGDPEKYFDEWRKNSLPLLLNPRLSKTILEIQGHLSWLEKVSGLEAFKEYLDEKLKPLKEFASITVVRIFFGKTNGAMLKVVYHPDDIKDEDLNRIFSTDGARKKLLSIKDMAARAKYDMGARASPTFSPTGFAAIKHAVTLAKLSLLGPDELNKLVKSYDDRLPDVFSHPSNGEPFNLLFGSVRSIDGDHQWNQFSPPYLRSNDSGCNAQREYGYEGGGFKLWSNEDLRTRVFNKVFAGMIAPAMYDNTFKPDLVRQCYKDRYHPTENDPFPRIKPPNARAL